MLMNMDVRRRFSSGVGSATDGDAALPDGDRGETTLGGAAASGSEFAYVVEEDRPLQFVELGGVEGDLGEEGVGHQNGCFVVAARVGVAEQGGDIHLQGTGETVE